MDSKVVARISIDVESKKETTEKEQKMHEVS